MTLDMGRAFTYMFEDESWIMKIVIGGILLVIPILGLLMVLGYILEALKGAAEGADVPLPEWDDFGGKFMKGLMVFIIMLVYAIPAFVGWCCMFGLLPLMGDSETAATMMSLLTACAGCLIFVWVIVVIVFWPAALIRYAVTDEFMSAFQFGELFSFISANLANYIVAIILYMVASFIAGFGWIACIVGMLFTMFWAYLVMANLLGQVQRESQAAA